MKNEIVNASFSQLSALCDTARRHCDVVVICKRDPSCRKWLWYIGGYPSAEEI
jgi:ribosomal protein L36